MVFNESGLSPKDVDVLEVGINNCFFLDLSLMLIIRLPVQVHDCFSVNELLVCEAVGLCKEGEGGKLVDSGRWITNSQGGQLFQVNMDSPPMMMVIQKGCCGTKLCRSTLSFW